MGGYVTLPERLLSEGSLGDDPFNDRRSISALGGLSVLQSFALLFLPVTFIHLIDPGMAILGTPLVLHWLGKRHGWPAWLAPALTLFSLALRHGQANASATTLPPLFLLSLYGLLDELAMEDRARTKLLLALALVAAAVITLKQVLIPGTGLILILFLMIDWIVRRNWARTLVSGVVAASATLLFLAPWLISMNRAAGTPLYPLLGKGYRANPMVDLPALVPVDNIGLKMHDLFKDAIDPRTLVYMLLGLAGVMALSFGKLPVRRRITYLAVLLGSTPAVLLLAIVFSKDEFIRYGYPYMLLVFLTSFALLSGYCRRTGVDRWRRPRGETVAGGVPDRAHARWLALQELDHRDDDTRHLPRADRQCLAPGCRSSCLRTTPGVDPARRAVSGIPSHGPSAGLRSEPN